MQPETAPSGWRASTLGDVAKYINGFPFKPHQWKDHGLPIIRIAQMHDPEASCDYFPGYLFRVRDGSSRTPALLNP
jgi:type I restriction enzyme S subunit